MNHAADAQGRWQFWRAICVKFQIAQTELSMNRALRYVILGLLFAPALSMSQSAFNGTWRPDPEKPGQPGKPEVTELANGMYDCQACKPPYKIKADGHDQPVAGNPYYDTMSVSITDDRTVILTGKSKGKTVVATKVTVSTDGANKTEVQTISGMSPAPIEMTRHFDRVAAAPKGSHLISGGWQWTQMEVSNNAEDTIYAFSGDVFSMSDRMGRSFSAKLDGTEAPYSGDPEFTTVSLKLIDPRTIEESDLNAGQVVKITRWTISADGRTIHARFEDTKGHVQNQDGHKVQ